MKNSTPKIISFHLNVLFHFYQHHKNLVGPLRIWFICRHILNPTGTGCVDTDQLIKFTGDNLRHTIRSCRKSGLFSGIGHKKIYYLSWKAICKLHKLRMNGTLKRKQRLNKGLLELLNNNTKFKALIIRLYAECDLDRKYKRKITVGRLSYTKMAKKFNVSKRTIIYQIQISKAKIIPNTRVYQNIEIKTTLSNWILINMDTVVDDQIKDRVGDNPYAYSIQVKNEKNYLMRTLPNRFKFTGISLVRFSLKAHWGQRQKTRPP